MTTTKKSKDWLKHITIREAYHHAFSKYTFLSETDVKIIITHFNHLPFNELALHYEDKCQNADDFFNVCTKVNGGYPLQYALQSADFLGHNFYVDERVLIPRGESEELVVIMNNIIKEDNLVNPLVADICTGSGVIGLSLKRSNPNATIYLSDISSDALSVADINRKNLKLEAHLLHGSSLEPLINNGIKVDYLVANPPYVNTSDEVGDNVIKHEPHLALFSDDKIVYKDIFTNIHKVMRSDKIVMMLEINEKDGKMMLDLASSLLNGKIDAKIIKDIHQKDRFILIRYTL